MLFVVAGFGLFIVVVGLIGVVRPEVLLRFARLFESMTGLYTAAAVRVFLGVVLIIGAPESRAPLVLRILGVFILVAGLITPFFGVERFRRIIAWWTSRSPVFQRAWALCAVAIGVLIIWLVVPSR